MGWRRAWRAPLGWLTVCAFAGAMMACQPEKSNGLYELFLEGDSMPLGPRSTLHVTFYGLRQPRAERPGARLFTLEEPAPTLPMTFRYQAPGDLHTLIPEQPDRDDAGVYLEVAIDVDGDGSICVGDYLDDPPGITTALWQYNGYLMTLGPTSIEACTAVGDLRLGLPERAWLERYVAASRVRARSRCECVEPSLDRDLCVDRRAETMLDAGCILEGARAAGWTDEDFLCLVEAEEEHARCVSEADTCSMASSCPSTATDCGDHVASPSSDFRDAQDACIADRIIGATRGCRVSESPARTIGAAVFTGTTVGQGNDTSPGCRLGDDGADVAHGWVAPTTGRFRFDSGGSTAEVLLHVRRDCIGPDLVCDPNNAHEARPEGGSLVELDATRGDELVVIVDTRARGRHGDSVVNVTEVP